MNNNNNVDGLGSKDETSHVVTTSTEVTTKA
jgi:hypothetical protein